MGGGDGDTQKLVRGLARAPAARCASLRRLSAPRATGEAGRVLQGNHVLALNHFSICHVY